MWPESWKLFVSPFLTSHFNEFQEVLNPSRVKFSCIFSPHFDLGRLGGAYQFDSSVRLTPGGETVYYDDQKEWKVEVGGDPINHLPESVEVRGAGLLPDWRFIAILV